jgi:hypothetical protein
MLEGRNYWADLGDGEGIRRLGWYTNRFVEAPDLATAEAKVLASFPEELKIMEFYATLRNNPDDPPLIQVKESQELGSFDDVGSLHHGLGFFADDHEAE